MKKANTSGFSKEIFEKVPIVGIMRNIPWEIVEKILPLYVEAGLTTLEITMNSKNAEEIISAAVKLYGNTLNIGAGTVCTVDDLERAIAAGAQFIVTPIVKKKVIKACVKRKIPIFPGAFTPTEVFTAWELGAEMVKVFPSGILGAKYLNEVLAPLNHVNLLATGGVSLDNIDSYLEAGVKGLGIGSPLFVKTLIEEENWEKLSDHFKQFVAKVKKDN